MKYRGFTSPLKSSDCVSSLASSQDLVKQKQKSYSTLKNSVDISTANPQVFHIQVSSIFKIFNAGNSRKRMKSPLKDFFPVNSQQKRNVTLNYSVQLVMNRVSAL